MLVFVLCAGDKTAENEQPNKNETYHSLPDDGCCCGRRIKEMEHVFGPNSMYSVQYV
jgi:hypothetical protein